MGFEIIWFIIIFVIMFLFIKLNYKKCENNVERILFILYSIIVMTPIIIYYLDLWNIPSNLKLTRNIESQNWLSFLANYTSSIISAIIGATVSIYLVFFQIRKNNEDTEKRDKENLRFQNMPILKYTIDTKQNVPIELKNLVETNIESLKTYQLTVGIKNIGLNSIKSIKVDMKINELNIKKSVLGNNTLEVLEKGNEIFIRKFFKLEGNNQKYNFEIIVCYEDLLNNWYKQIINVEYLATDYLEDGNYIGNIEYIVNKEIQEN